MNRLIASCLAIFLFVGCSKPPTDEQLRTLLGNVHETLMNKETTLEENDIKAEELLANAQKEFDIMSVSAKQFGILTNWNTMFRSKAVRNWIAPRLTELSAKQDKEGAIATYYKIVYDPQRDNAGYVYDEIQTLLNHPAIGEVLNDSIIGVMGIARLLNNMVGDKADKAEAINLVAPHINDQISDESVRNLVFIFDQALELDEQMSAAELESLRQRIIAQQERVLATADTTNLKGGHWAVENLKYLNSLFAQGKLIGGEAPELNFLWTSKGNAQKLSDLKGKIVVLDYWATWCGPCVAAFSNIRELQKRYKDAPVEIIGITSLQGRHTVIVEGKRENIDTKNDPEKEYNLMKEFMNQMDMTWTVAFSSQPVFNSEYGVKGIPHVVIIDAEGKVRYNRLNPLDAPYHEAEKIDALLKEAGLPAPKQPMAQPNSAL